MGLDGIELLMAVEEEFCIEINDKDAAEIRTPRMLADYVVSRLGKMEHTTGKCLSQAGFYRIRSVLVQQFGAERQAVKPDALIRTWLNQDIKQQWQTLATAINATHLPVLSCRKSWLLGLLVGLPVLGVLLLGLVTASIKTLVAAALLLWFVGLMLTKRVADVIPESLQTVGALVPYVRVEDPAKWTADYVLQKIQQITAAQLGLNIEQVYPDAHFVNDLKMN